MRDRAARDFDKSNSALLDDVIADMGKLHFIMLYCVLKGNPVSPPSHFQAFSLIGKSFDFLVSAFRMTRERASLEALSLLRTAIESACVAYQICEDSTRFESYLGNNTGTTSRFSATKAISFTNKSVPRVGEVYGALSQGAVHANARLFGPRRKTKEDGKSASLVIDLWHREEDLVAESTTLLLVQLCSLVILRITELILTEPIANRDWRRIRGTATEYFGATEEEIEQIYNRFIQMAGERKSRENQN